MNDAIAAQASPQARIGITRFPAEVRFANACAVLEQVAAGLAVPAPAFDLSDCQRFDSSLIALLLELSRRAAAEERACVFVQPSSNLRKLAGLYGVEALLFGARPR